MAIIVRPFSRKPTFPGQISSGDDEALHTFSIEQGGYFTGFVLNRDPSNLIDASLISMGTDGLPSETNMLIPSGNALCLKNQKIEAIKIYLDPANSGASAVKYDIQGKIHIPTTAAEAMSLESDSEYFLRAVLGGIAVSIAQTLKFANGSTLKQDASGFWGFFNIGGTEVAFIDQKGNLGFPATAGSDLGAVPGICADSSANTIVNMKNSAICFLAWQGSGYWAFAQSPPYLYLAGNILSQGNMGFAFEPKTTLATPIALGTTSTAILAYTPAVNGQYRVTVVIACKTAATLSTLTVTYTDGTTGATMTQTLASALACSANAGYTYVAICNATTASAVSVQGTASAGSDLYASATIEMF